MRERLMCFNRWFTNMEPTISYHSPRPRHSPRHDYLEEHVNKEQVNEGGADMCFNRWFNLEQR